MARLPIQPSQDTGTTRMVSAALTSMLFYVSSLAAAAQLAQIVTAHERTCLKILRSIVRSITRLFLSQATDEAARGRVLRRKRVSLGLAAMYIAMRALRLLDTGPYYLDEPSTRDFSRHVDSWLKCSWRQHYDATYASFFLMGRLALTFMNISGDEATRSYVQRSEALLAGFYMRLLMNPLALFTSHIPPMTTLAWRGVPGQGSGFE